jgi:hypothetical protein
MGFQPKNLKIWMVLNLINVYQCHSPQKIEQKIPPITLILKYICKILYFVTSIILLDIHFIRSNSLGFVV